MPPSIPSAALRYLCFGWSVIPVGRATKRPLIGWKAFQNRLSTEAEIAGWWQRWPDANVGIVTGAVSGLIVLDSDGAEGIASLATCPLLPPTAIAVTGRGRHYYFRHPGGAVRNFTSRLPGLDLRADGGYVVAPPSLHASGALYQWEVEPLTTG